MNTSRCAQCTVHALRVGLFRSHYTHRNPLRIGVKRVQMIGRGE